MTRIEMAVRGDPIQDILSQVLLQIDFRVPAVEQPAEPQRYIDRIVRLVWTDTAASLGDSVASRYFVRDSVSHVLRYRAGQIYSFDRLAAEATDFKRIVEQLKAKLPLFEGHIDQPIRELDCAVDRMRHLHNPTTGRRPKRDERGLLWALLIHFTKWMNRWPDDYFPVDEAKKGTTKPTEIGIFKRLHDEAGHGHIDTRSFRRLFISVLREAQESRPDIKSNKN